MGSAGSRRDDDPVRDEAFRRELVGLIPHLRAFARSVGRQLSQPVATPASSTAPISAR